ncbi:Uncharacterized protein Rs2_37426 [Raphanus sativus]|nr:Uncharacterized protein Rs2_37426 [Raphanus sativus]
MESHFLVAPSNPRSGGLALLWKSDIDIQVNAACANFVDTLITFKKTKFYSTFVYGAPEVPRRQEVWNRLTSLGVTLMRSSTTQKSRVERTDQKVPSVIFVPSLLLMISSTCGIKVSPSRGEEQDTLTMCIVA